MLQRREIFLFSSHSGINLIEKELFFFLQVYGYVCSMSILGDVIETSLLYFFTDG